MMAEIFKTDLKRALISWGHSGDYRHGGGNLFRDVFADAARIPEADAGRAGDRVFDPARPRRDAVRRAVARISHFVRAALADDHKSRCLREHLPRARG